MSMTIFYEVYNGLYVNLTNRCNAHCTFCLRHNADGVYNSDSLWLEREPTLDELKAAFEKVDINKYSEIVFCGYGEPTMRLDTMVQFAKYIKEKLDIIIRVNTNGLANLLYNEDVSYKFEGWCDAVSISLNTPNPDRYFELTRNDYGKESFEGMLDFAKKVKAYVDVVKMTTVATTITKEEEDKCREICESIGVEYRIREFEG